MSIEKSIREIKDIQAELNIKIEKVLKEISETNDDTLAYNIRGGNYDIIFRDLVNKYYSLFIPSICRDETQKDYWVYMDHSKIKIKFPPANDDWSLAIMKACIEFCESVLPGSYPSFQPENDKNTLYIKLGQKK